jgi:hypothetical protein
MGLPVEDQVPRTGVPLKKKHQSRSIPEGYAEPEGCWRFVALFLSLFWSGVFGGVIAVIAIPLVVFVLGWIGGAGQSGYPLRGSGLPATPLSLTAAKNAFGNAFLIGVLGALPIFAVGGFIGLIVGLVRRVRKR